MGPTAPGSLQVPTSDSTQSCIIGIEEASQSGVGQSGKPVVRVARTGTLTDVGLVGSCS